jgi:orotidine-5'-phosphate decarboxylase
MIELNGELPAEQRVILAVDTSELGRARELVEIAREAGASLVKLGLQVSSAPGSSWEVCSAIAAEAGIDWVADTKSGDISNTTGEFFGNILRLDHPPAAITMLIPSGIESMRVAQDTADEKGIVILGVTELTSIKEEELRETYADMLAELGVEEIPEDIDFRKLLVRMHARRAAKAGLKGLVASPKELVDPIKKDPDTADKFTMVPGVRSEGEAAHDQQNVDTPYQATVNDADSLVIGRQITGNPDPIEAFRRVVKEIQDGLDEKARLVAIGTQG